MDRYVKQEKGGGDIGKGAYGVVYKGTDKQTGKTVAMKVRSRWINSPHINSPK
jgi:serine/threonine protein kinase